MKSSTFNFFFTFALATIIFQSVGVQSVDAQQRMFGNGRFLKRVFGDITSPSASAKQSKLAPPAKKLPFQPSQPTAARRPQNAQPTLASKTSRPHSPRAIQPDSSDTNQASINRLPKSSATVDADSIPTRSNAKATLGFGMLVELENDKLYVSRLEPDGNAANAGVRVGDRLVAGGGIDFESLSDYNGVGDILEDGDQLEFELERNGREKETMIVFGKAPEDQAAADEGSVQKDSTGPTNPRRSLLAPRVDQITTSSNSSFLPTKQNVEVQQRNQVFSLNDRQSSGRSNAFRTISNQQTEIGSQVRNAVTAPAPSLQLPTSAESVMN